MKNLIFFATLLIFISDNVISAEAATEEVPDPVLDTDGDKLKTGTSYYIAPTFSVGGGVTIYPRANKTCTYAVAKLGRGAGLPVTFANGRTDLGEVVRESTDIMIAFSPGILFCTAVWKVDEYDEAAKQHFVTAGEFDGNLTSINIWFQIRKSTLPTLSDYRFVFCPKVICTNVGIYTDSYDRVGRLALGGNFLTFGFRKVQPCANSNALEA